MRLQHWLQRAPAWQLSIALHLLVLISYWTVAHEPRVPDCAFFDPAPTAVEAVIPFEPFLPMEQEVVLADAFGDALGASSEPPPVELEVELAGDEDGLGPELHGGGAVGVCEHGIPVDAVCYHGDHGVSIPAVCAHCGEAFCCIVRNYDHTPNDIDWRGALLPVLAPGECRATRIPTEGFDNVMWARCIQSIARCRCSGCDAYSRSPRYRALFAESLDWYRPATLSGR